MFLKSAMKRFSTASVLTFAGAVPFVLAAIFMYWDLERLPLIGDVQKVTDVYGLVIVVFIAGSFWGISVNLSEKKRSILLVISNGLTLLTFYSYFWLKNIPFQLVLIFLLVVLLLVDYWLYFLEVNTKEYVTLRLVVSIIVVGSLSIVFSS